MGKRSLSLLIVVIVFSSCLSMPDPVWRVTYSVDDSVEGVPPSDRTEYVLNDTIEVMSPDRLRKEGYVFKEWNTHRLGNGQSYKPGSTITLDTPGSGYRTTIQLYAQWEEAVFTVHFDGNGHTAGAIPDTQQFQAGREGWDIGNWGGLIRTDHIFTGWNTKPDGTGEMFSSISRLPDNDMTLYARWVSYDAKTDPANEMVLVPGGRFTMNTIQDHLHYTGEYELLERSSEQAIQPFLMARYPVHEKLYVSVLTWGLENGYEIRYGGGAGLLSGSELVAARSSWIMATLWCNMYSEMMGYTPVYRDGTGAVLRRMTNWQETSDYDESREPLFDGTDKHPFVMDDMHIDRSADGFRLPREAEWQYAAAYIDGRTWLPATHVSGDTSAPYGVSSRAEEYARQIVYGGHPVLGSGKANFLGLHDMSGSIPEFCEEPWPVMHQGSAGYDAMWTVKGYMEIGRRGGEMNAGFRVVRNAS
jgi:uncharacterized repeat protein (TIGR02543 family)